MKSVYKEYTNGEVTIVWQNALCTHSARCFRGLPAVFDPRARPWITPDGTALADIVRQVEQCPSGALTWYRTADGRPPHLGAPVVDDAAPSA